MGQKITAFVAHYVAEIPLSFPLWYGFACDFFHFNELPHPQLRLQRTLKDLCVWNPRVHDGWRRKGVSPKHKIGGEKAISVKILRMGIRMIFSRGGRGVRFFKNFTPYMGAFLSFQQKFCS